jgi:hypothetical protein
MLLIAIAAAAIATTIAVGASGIIPGFHFSILPGFEGLTSGVEGVTISGAFFQNTASTSLPAGYSWLSNDARYPILVKNLQAGTCAGQVRIETRTAYQITDALTAGRTVDYWVRDGSQYIHVKGEIITYSLPITFAISNTWGGNPMDYPDVFTGEKVWFAIGSLTWDKALQEQSPISGAASQLGSAWEAPIYAVIQDYSVSDAGLHYKVAPRDVGREITLYSSTSQSGTVSGLWASSDLNGTLAGSLSPDTRMQQNAYVCFTLEDFGEEVVNAGIGGTHAPVVNLVLKVYALRIGEFTYTNPDDTPWAAEAPDTSPAWWAWITDPIASFFSGISAAISSWASSPLTVFGIFLAVGLAIIIALVAFFLFTGAGRALGMWAESAARRRSSSGTGGSGGGGSGGSSKGSMHIGAALLGIGLVLLASGIALPMAGFALPAFAAIDDGISHISLSTNAVVAVNTPLTVYATLYHGAGAAYGGLAGETVSFYADGSLFTTQTTGDFGKASATVTFSTAGPHVIGCEFAGNDYPDGSHLPPAISQITITAVQPTNPPTTNNATVSASTAPQSALNWLTITGAGITSLGAVAAVVGAFASSRRHVKGGRRK